MENGRLSVHWDAQSERSTGMLSHMAVLAVDCSPVIIQNVHLELFREIYHLKCLGDFKVLY